jgi:hypothetical protein
MGLLAEDYLKDKKTDKAGPLLSDAIKILHSDEGVNIPRETKLQVLSTYSDYLEQTGDRQKLDEVKAELNSV